MDAPQRLAVLDLIMDHIPEIQPIRELEAFIALSAIPYKDRIRWTDDKRRFVLLLILHCERAGHDASNVSGLQRLVEACANLAGWSAEDTAAFHAIIESSPSELDEPNGQARLKLLFLSANPDRDSFLAVDREFRHIALRLEATTHHHLVELMHWPDVHTTDLPARLRREPPDILHFAGHGFTDGSLLMRDRDGNPHRVSPHALAGFILQHDSTIRLVVLNGCYSQELAELLAQKIPCIVGMSHQVTDRAAVIFSATFYESLWDGASIQEAFDVSCHAIAAEGLDEHHIPRLVTSSGVAPTGLRMFSTSLGDAVTPSR